MLRNFSPVDRATLFSAEKQKRKAAEERQLAREKRAEEVMHIWEKQILPDWKVVHRNLELRKLWWQGVPTSIRGRIWENVVGNPLSLSKGNSHSNAYWLSLIGSKIRTAHVSPERNDHSIRRHSR